MRREVFFEIGGFTEPLPLNFNDVDLCYKLRKEGYRIVWLANCEVYHFESRTRGTCRGRLGEGPHGPALGAAAQRPLPARRRRPPPSDAARADPLT